LSEKWEWLAEGALQLSLSGEMDPLRQRRLLAMAAPLRAEPGVLDVVPGMLSLTILTDPLRLAPSELEQLARQAWRKARPAREEGKTLEVPVRYGGEGGPDLLESADLAGLSIADFIDAHTLPLYEVAFLGFLPGFPYLMGLPEALHLPRRSQPRLRVPEGSVGIGGAQTGIYPLESPGGWQLIGRTELRFFDATRTAPSLLLPGDRLRFVPIGGAA
jgi:KipI family sensor histidine kinase inhibitor